MTSRRTAGARAPVRTSAHPWPLAVVTSLLLVTSALIPPAGTALAGPPPTADPSERSLSAGPDDAKLADSGSVVKALLRPEKLSAAPGGAVAFEVVFTVANGWHLYAHGDTVFYGIALKGPEKAAAPAADKGRDQAGDTAAAKGSAASALGDLTADYPAGTPGDFFGTPVKLLAGRQVIRVRSIVRAGAKTGKVDVPLGLEVQACDDQRCLAPATIPLKLRLDVKRPR